MTDKEIVKALECCRDDCCVSCPLYLDCEDCVSMLITSALDILKRKKAKINLLQKDCETLDHKLKWANITIECLKADNDELEMRIMAGD